MIKNNLTTLVSVANNYKLGTCYSNKNRVTENTPGFDKKDTISISTFNVDTLSEREAKVDSLKERIQSGEYKIDNRLTSSAMIEVLHFLK